MVWGERASNFCSKNKLIKLNWKSEIFRVKNVQVKKPELNLFALQLYYHIFWTISCTQNTKKIQKTESVAYIQAHLMYGSGDMVLFFSSQFNSELFNSY